MGINLTDSIYAAQNTLQHSGMAQDNYISLKTT